MKRIKNGFLKGFKKSGRMLSLLFLVLLMTVSTVISGCGGIEIVFEYEDESSADVSYLAEDSSAAQDESTEGYESTESETAFWTESEPASSEHFDETESESAVTEDGVYTTKQEVAFYLHTYGHLPDNFITKRDAEDLGFVSKEGNLWEVAPGKSIGGSRFGNYEGLLPDKKGRKWYECDINYEGGYRGAERIVYSNDGLIYYTGDHYKTFEQLY